MMLLGLMLCAAGPVLGCGGEGAPSAPERKEKQEVVQDKMKDFMKKANLPNRPQ